MRARRSSTGETSTDLSKGGPRKRRTLSVGEIGAHHSPASLRREVCSRVERVTNIRSSLYRQTYHEFLCPLLRFAASPTFSSWFIEPLFASDAKSSEIIKIRESIPPDSDRAPKTAKKRMTSNSNLLFLTIVNPYLQLLSDMLGKSMGKEDKPHGRDQNGLFVLKSTEAWIIPMQQLRLAALLQVSFTIGGTTLDKVKNLDLVQIFTSKAGVARITKLSLDSSLSVIVIRFTHPGYKRTQSSATEYHVHWLSWFSAWVHLDTAMNILQAEQTSTANRESLCQKIFENTRAKLQNSGFYTYLTSVNQERARETPMTKHLVPMIDSERILGLPEKRKSTKRNEAWRRMLHYFFHQKVGLMRIAPP
ncbi:hypothetical protein BGW36DRAFT_452320 [Talaromyces proteolyticus]|uniref:Uncharacterized protein n=1 Tax=Talaromyces proteolyticus TaxID=1131652 RepID=A0AAD4KTJ6_9EURO|nr:uncharacterized protein BGW36DRAFT_452320 [Talaromyces proteolyticus]KAH8696600.1 hypothetical protein BGW36DRAFT_452320 [Talaromyces proteolyticus]